MRTVHRLLAVVTALLLGAGLVGTGPAAHGEQAERDITIKGIEPQPNKFVVKGKVSPSTGKRVDALLEVKHCKKDKDCGADWTTFDSFTTNRRGRYSEQVRGPKKGHMRVYYRVSTEESKSFLAAVSEEIFIYRVF